MIVRERLAGAIAENRGWFTVLGIVFVLAGTAALAFPVVSSIAVDVVVGVSMLVAGIASLILAFGVGSWGRFFLQIVAGVIYAVAGAALLVHPVHGAVALTLLAGFAFIVEGIVRCGFAIQIRPERGWGWMLFGSIVGVLVGIMLLIQLPISGLWALGVLAGINLLVTGWTFIMLAMVSSETATPLPTGSSAAT